MFFRRSFWRASADGGESGNRRWLALFGGVLIVFIVFKILMVIKGKVEKNEVTGMPGALYSVGVG